MISNLEKEVCNLVKLKPRKINDKKVLQILELLIRHFNEIKFVDCSKEICNYDLLCEIPSKLNRDDEEHPFQGYGWELKNSILSIILDNECQNNFDFVEDLRWLLATPVEQVKEVLWI